jgi:mRNA-degrading endonuclease YafQ of YafQ-DinJ toxin-antitoxin module
VPVVVSTVSFDKYLRFLKQIIEEARDRYGKRDLENAYINYFKFAEFFMKLKNHPEFKLPRYEKNVKQFQQALTVAVEHIENIVVAMDEEEDLRISNREHEELADMFDSNECDSDDSLLAYFTVNTDHLWKQPVNSVPLIPATPTADGESKESQEAKSPGGAQAQPRTPTAQTDDMDLWKSLQSLTLQKPIPISANGASGTSRDSISSSDSISDDFLVVPPASPSTSVSRRGSSADVSLSTTPTIMELPPAPPAPSAPCAPASNGVTVPEATAQPTVNLGNFRAMTMPPAPIPTTPAAPVYSPAPALAPAPAAVASVPTNVRPSIDRPASFGGVAGGPPPQAAQTLSVNDR